MSQVLQALNDAFQRMSPREQRLAMATGLVLVVGAVFLIVRGAIGRIDQLDAQIAQMQDNIINANRLLTRKSLIESQYAQVASQHSSAWTEAEIYDRLRGEIYRLAQKNPPPLQPDGTAAEITNEGGELVKIPTLRQGTLDEGGEGYREYSIPLRIPGTTFEDLIDYIERLQGSPQSLRIDSLDLQRDPLTRNVSANLQLTRTVVDGEAAVDASEGIAIAEIPDDTEGMEINLSDWSGEGCVLNGGGTALRAESTEAGGRFYMERALPAGETFEMILDANASGPGRLAIGDADADREFEGAAELLTAADGPQRYRLRFTVPGDSGRTTVRFPCITLGEKGAKLQIEKLVVRSV